MLNTSQICAQLGVVVSVETMEKAGLTRGGKDKRAILWAEDWPTVCQKLGDYIHGLAAKQPAAPAPKPPKAKKVAPKQEPLPINGDSDDDWEDEEL